MPLNIEFCLRVKTEMKHNPVASVLLLSSSRQRGFKNKNKNKTKPEMAESKAECEGEVELSWLTAEAGKDLKENIETVDQRWSFYCFELLWRSNSADGKESVRILPRRWGVKAQRCNFWAAEILLLGKQKINEKVHLWKGLMWILCIKKKTHKSY